MTVGSRKAHHVPARTITVRSVTIAGRLISHRPAQKRRQRSPECVSPSASSATLRARPCRASADGGARGLELWIAIHDFDEGVFAGECQPK